MHLSIIDDSRSLEYPEISRPFDKRGIVDSMAKYPSILTSAQLIKEGEEFLARTDPVLKKLISSQKLIIPEPEMDYFYALSNSIISQQVSLAAARSIFARYMALTECKPEIVNTLSIDELRSAGLSRQKATYLSDLAEHFVTDPGVYNHIDSLDDDSIIQDLTAVKGIGVWTAQMFMIFTLGRQDVFAPADIGLQRAIMTLYSIDEKPSPSQLTELSETWKPYRTIASLHLWQSLENTP